MPITEYICKICEAYRSRDENDVIEHEKILIADMGIDGLVLKDPKARYHVFRDSGILTPKHEVMYRKDIFCDDPPSKLSLVNTAKFISKITKTKVYPDDVCEMNKMETGWMVLEDQSSMKLYHLPKFFKKVIEKEELSETETDEFIDVVRKLKKVNPDFYQGVEFQQNIPEDLV